MLFKKVNLILDLKSYYQIAKQEHIYYGIKKEKAKLSQWTWFDWGLISSLETEIGISEIKARETCMNVIKAKKEKQLNCNI